jgi:cation:H+ antiporter
MSTWIWAAVLLASAAVTHWGAERLAKPLGKLTRQWGITGAAGGALVALVTAGSEIGINTTSALRGVSDIGLGMSLGSNVFAVPLTVVVVYLATRKRRLGSGEEGEDSGADGSESNGSESDGSGSEDSQSPSGSEDAEAHRRHVERHVLRVSKETVTVLTLPYFGLLALVAVLTLPLPWRGLQPLDAAVLLVGYALYLAQALMRGRGGGEDASWSRKEVALAVAGVAAMGVGAYFVVRASENVASGLGLSEIVTGLLITALATALPELFGAWSIARSGQVTAATSSVIGDHAVTMTVALVPLALVGLPVEDLRLFAVNLAFVGFVPTLYAAFIWWGGAEKGFRRWQVAALAAVVPVWAAVVYFWAL